MSKQFYKTPGAAEFLGLSKRTLEGKRLDGTGPAFIKVGGSVLYAEEDLIAWIDSFPKVRSTTELVQLAGAA